MFTPPPSPQPSKQKHVVTIPETSPSLTPSPSPPPPHAMSSHDQKRRTGRRFRWAVLVVPLVLILITASTRYLTHPMAFDAFSDPSAEWSQLLTQSTNWRPHKRHPSPEPQIAITGPSTTSGNGTPPPSPTASRTVSRPIPTIPSMPPVLPTPFPQPYDPQLTLNFSSVSCLSFFTNMTQSTAFRPCRPFSLLSSTSDDFISAQSNLTLMNTLIWGTCNINPGVNQCMANIGWFASTLQNVCAEDLRDRNTLAVDTLTALNAYKVMYDAACLEEPTSNAYCYINAVANPNPADLYFYQLPLGIALPRTIRNLTCSPCSRNIMGIYAAALSNETLAGGLTGLRATYESAAQLALSTCGDDYARSGVVNGAQALKLSVGFGGMLVAVLSLWSLVL